MILTENQEDEMDKHIPRICGGDPDTIVRPYEFSVYSPRPQGTAPTHLCRGNLFYNTQKPLQKCKGSLIRSSIKKAMVSIKAGKRQCFLYIRSTLHFHYFYKAILTVALYLYIILNTLFVK